MSPAIERTIESSCDLWEHQANPNFKSFKQICSWCNESGYEPEGMISLVKHQQIGGSE